MTKIDFSFSQRYLRSLLLVPFSDGRGSFQKASTVRWNLLGFSPMCILRNAKSCGWNFHETSLHVPDRHNHKIGMMSFPAMIVQELNNFSSERKSRIAVDVRYETIQKINNAW